MHEVLVNRLGGLSLPRKSVVRLTDRPNTIQYNTKQCIPMGTNCAPHIANLFLFCFERDSMASYSNNKKDVII